MYKADSLGGETSAAAIRQISSIKLLSDIYIYTHTHTHTRLDKNRGIEKFPGSLKHYQTLQSHSQSHSMFNQTTRRVFKQINRRFTMKTIHEPLSTQATVRQVGGHVAADSFDMQADQWRRASFCRESLRVFGGVSDCYLRCTRLTRLASKRT